MEQATEEPPTAAATADNNAAMHSAGGDVSGQKRSRDYGEKLKGLTPEPEDDLEVLLSPKKAKISHVDEAEYSEKSEDMDDGEIVESSPESHEPMADAAEIRLKDPQPSVTPQEEVSGHVERPASTEGPSIPPSGGYNLGVNIGSRTSFGSKSASTLKTLPGVASSKPLVPIAAELHTPGGVIQDSPDDESHNQDSNGNGVQTSFELNATSTLKTEPIMPSSKSPLPTVAELGTSGNAIQISSDNESDNQDSDADAGDDRKVNTRSSSDKTGRTITIDHDGTWFLPLDNLQELPFERSMKKNSGSYWKRHIAGSGLEDFIGTLLKANSPIPASALRGIVEAAFNVFLQEFIVPVPGLPTPSKRHMLRAKKIGIDTLREMPSDKFDAVVRRAKDKESEHLGVPNPEVLADAEDEEPEASKPLLMYFPGLENSVHCTNCAGTAHSTQDCPQLACRFCGSKSHTLFACSTKKRCDKCRQVGHPAESCQEKLALPKEDAPPCAICEDNHTENECNEIWRSFNPNNMAIIKRVKQIPAFCFTCGAKGHFGPECGLPAKSGSTLDRKTWSQAVRDFYVDPNSPDAAIGWVNIDMSQTRAESNFHIRGKATKQTHIQYVSSDDSDEEFIKAPIKKSQPADDIKIALAKTAPNKTAPKPNRARPRNRKGGRSDPLPGTVPGNRGPQSDQYFGSFQPPNVLPPSLPPHPPPVPYFQGNGGQQWQPPLPPGPPPPPLPPALPAPSFSGYVTQGQTSHRVPAQGPDNRSRRSRKRDRGMGRGSSNYYRKGKGN